MREGTASAWKSVRRAKENEKLFYRVYIYIYTVSGVTLDPSTGGGPCNLYFLFIYIYTGCQSKSGYQPFGASKISKTCVAVCKGALKKTMNIFPISRFDDLVLEHFLALHFGGSSMSNP